MSNPTKLEMKNAEILNMACYQEHIDIIIRCSRKDFAGTLINTTNLEVTIRTPKNKLDNK